MPERQPLGASANAPTETIDDDPEARLGEFPVLGAREVIDEYQCDM